MLDMPRAMQVTLDCIRATVNLYPPADFPINPEDTLVRLGIDDTRIDSLIAKIAGDPKRGLPSLIPKRKIDPNLLDIDESSRVVDVFSRVWQNAVLA